MTPYLCHCCVTEIYWNHDIPNVFFLISINHPTLTVNKAKIYWWFSFWQPWVTPSKPILLFCPGWKKKKTIEYLFFEASQSVPIFEGNAHKPICARLEEELQLAGNITEWAKFKMKYWRFNAAAQVGFVLLWQAGPVKCGHWAHPKSHCNFFFFSSHPSPPAALGLFLHGEKKIHKLWEWDVAHALATLAFRGRTEISFMWRYVEVHVSSGNKRETVINNRNAFQIGSCYLRQPQQKINKRWYMSSRLVNTALGCISFPGSLKQ